ncbi:uncharacterized protein LOC135833684 [Planococcus citri]|uniref:uncharacterized protein LOC135833684 n=1 Tax=Planococcus citri TaxID=170843 RepID=UPI0031FA26B1
MNNYFLLIVNFFAFIYSAVHTDAQGMESETFVLNVNVDAHPDNYLQLPLTYIPTLQDQNVIRACPAEKGQDQTNLSEISKKQNMFYEYEYCLFRKPFGEGHSKICTEEVRPLLRAEIDGRTEEIKSCGFSKKHKLYSFGFYYCGEPGRLTQLENRKIKKHPLLFELDTAFFPIYQLCVDTSTRMAVWTKHSIMTPVIFKLYNEERLKQEEEENPTISTAALLFNGKTYESKAKLYDKQNDPKKPKMIRNLMVPRQHIAVKMWKKTINHYIIIAPLWDQLQLLMTEIDSVIKKLALILHSKNQLLTVYTKVVDSSTSSMIWGTRISNTWYKLLHEKKNNSATLIIVQNTPDKPPSKEIKLCDTRKQGDMRSWLPNVPEDTLRYAVSCIPSTEEIKKLFNVYLDFEGDLNIDTQLQTNDIDNNQPAQSHKSNQLGKIIQHQEEGPYPQIVVDSQDEIKMGRNRENKSTR